MNCSCYCAVRFLEHEMKVVEMVLEKRLCGIVTVDEMQLGFMLERGTIDAVFMLRRLQEVYHAKVKTLYVFCGTRESFWQTTKNSAGMGNEKGRNTRCFG